MMAGVTLLTPEVVRPPRRPPAILVLLAAFGVVVGLAMTGDEADATCGATEFCRSELVGYLILGVLVAAPITAFIHRGVAAALALAMAVTWLAQGENLPPVVDGIGLAFAALCLYVAWPRRPVETDAGPIQVTPPAPPRLPYLGRVSLTLGLLTLVGTAVIIAASTPSRDPEAPDPPWPFFALVTGAIGVALVLRSLARDRARRRLFTSAQPFHTMLVRRDRHLLLIDVVRDGADSTLVVPLGPATGAPVGPIPTREASIYGSIGPGQWCCAVIDCELLVPSGPARLVAGRMR